MKRVQKGRSQEAALKRLADLEGMLTAHPGEADWRDLQELFNKLQAALLTMQQ